MITIYVGMANDYIYINIVTISDINTFLGHLLVNKDMQWDPPIYFY